MDNNQHQRTKKTADLWDELFSDISHNQENINIYFSLLSMRHFRYNVFIMCCMLLSDNDKSGKCISTWSLNPSEI